MAYLSEIRDNRVALLKYFLSDQELVDLISDDTDHVVPSIDLQYTQVFPYPWIGKTITENKVFLCFKLASRAVNQQTKKTLIKVYAFMHEDKMSMPDSDCLRQDAILARIEVLLNGNEDLGVSDVEFNGFDSLDGLPSGFYGVWAEYYVKNFNRWRC